MFTQCQRRLGSARVAIAMISVTLNSWSFYQLRSFLEYKGIQFGVEVIAVPPAWTSQTCHKCLHIGMRSDKRFKCTAKTCSWSGDAD
ncbi:MAG: transposase [Nostoc sp.]|uniref:transposase n=2 Tax=Nostoc TaxID=1177 RepID=UPI0025FC36BA|nr:transposase [Nostoc sp. NMS7]